MSTGSAHDLTLTLAALDQADIAFAPRFVTALLDAARNEKASDVHLLPTAQGLNIRWRINGVLQDLGCFAPKAAANVISRLKVVANLLTYRNEIPQEGRINATDDHMEMRVSTFPTLFGEKAVVRLFPGVGQRRLLADLGLPKIIAHRLAMAIQGTTGAILVTGPAGCGKTTTVYAALRELASAEHLRSLVSLEDPIESAINGVAQSQINLAAGFTFPIGLRSLMRQDPEVILVGEIRDPVTAQTALEAALTGQLVLSTFHAGSAAQALSRLLEMGVEPYVVRSAVTLVIGQRLLRRLCECARWAEDPAGALGLPLQRQREAAGCAKCRNTGYDGRMVVAELAALQDDALGDAVLQRQHATRLELVAVAAGMLPLRAAALRCVREGATTPAEYRRVFGFDTYCDD